MKEMKITYTTFSRGFKDVITVDSDNLDYQVIAGDNFKGYSPGKVTEEDWKGIKNAMDGIDVKNISSYKAPSTDSYSDKGLAATLQIEKDGTTHSSVQFDEGNPPKELEPLLKEITALAKR